MKEFGAFISGICIAGLVWSMVLREADESWRKQIAKHGCAQFYIDDNGDRQWNWK